MALDQNQSWSSASVARMRWLGSNLSLPIEAQKHPGKTNISAHFRLRRVSAPKQLSIQLIKQVRHQLVMLLKAVDDLGWVVRREIVLDTQRQALCTSGMSKLIRLHPYG